MALNKIRNLYATFVINGLDACLFRSGYALNRKSGLLKRKFPIYSWQQLNLSSRLAQGEKPEDFLQKRELHSKSFFFDGSKLPVINDDKVKRQIITEADEVLKSRLRYFFDKSYYLGEKPDWFLNPQTSRHISYNQHWIQIHQFDADIGDIKFIWEPSRFAWAYTLVRAYTVTGQEKYAEKFWSLLESWLENNQPNMGPNYICGQECAIRLMAMCFALYGLSEAKASSAERKLKLITAIIFHAERIEKNIGFAISTQTNHSLTEAAGLYTAGILFPEFKYSSRWLKLGKKILTREGLKQIYPDGSYIQHSMNYHRLMLQNFLWVMRLGELNDDSFSEEIMLRVTKATEFLYQNQDSQTGRVPNYGANDGALIVPLNTCDYNDFRPVLQSCWYLLKREKLYEEGPWDEDLLWFFDPDSIIKPSVTKQRKSTAFDSGGYYTLRSKKSWAMCRCHSYKNRVGHVDPLHIDLWADGLNLLRDSGTYGYFVPSEPQLEYYFKSIWAHNTVIIDDASPLKLISRFQWWPLPKAKVLKFVTDGLNGEFLGENRIYHCPPWNVLHCRQIAVKGDNWQITDELLGQSSRNLELRWHLPAESQIILSQQNLVRIGLLEGWCLEVNHDGQMESMLLKERQDGGCESPTYGCMVPGATLSVKTISQLPALFHSIIYKSDSPEV